MRIADASFSQSLIDQIGDQQTVITGLQNQLASGQSITRPSDNPDGVVQALTLQSDVARTTAWQQNLNHATSWLGLANATANSVIQGLQQARTLILQAMNQGTQTASTETAIAEQLQGIAQNLTGLANTSFAGRPIFAGNANVQAAYDSAGNYLGDSNTPTVPVGAGPSPGTMLATSVTGPQLFGTGAASVFSTLATTVGHLTSGSPTMANLRADLSALDANMAQATGAAATLGNLSQQATGLQSATASQLTELQGQLGALVSVNVPKVATELQNDMTNYQAGLWAASKAVPPSLVEYL